MRVRSCLSSCSPTRSQRNHDRSHSSRCMRFPFYYYTGAALLGMAFVFSVVLPPAEVPQGSRWMMVMVFLAARPAECWRTTG